MKSILITSLLLMMSFTPSEYVVTYKTNNAQSTIQIEGTSTLHDWEMKAQNLTGTIDVDIYTDSINIKDLSLVVPVKSLKSGNSGMDNNAYKTLKSDANPQIRYQFASVRNLEKVSANKLKLVTKGRLTVGGKTQIMTIPLTATIKDRGVELAGTTRFKMSSFDLEPPTFMFGSVTTGDEITIHFTINFN